MKSILTESGFRFNFSVDLSWRALAVKLADSLNNPVKLPISKISKIGRYILHYKNEYNPADNDRLVGYVKLSRVAFNNKKDRACFIYEYNCGSLCGYGTMVFVEKINIEWKIVGQRELWVS